ncbi:PREDICTED: uncharacterized protein LOC103331858 isoform X2 [Prunus mume]|uniref:Uncharacterized protein LOC103331858 isoform X2 n=1 Tax=Prunus mume TaxID=102107 RepID=A0ABM1LQE6_PRUMU|nr:PREDICTED: uncharacterized protein LOC103331858 isoform X2 [Prunus mume]
MGMERLLICSRRGKGRVIPAQPNPNSTTIHCLHLFSVGSPLPSASLLQLSEWNLTHRHIAAVSATWLFCSAITTLQAFKRPIQSLEKLMDVMREELPNTMVVVRLSGMEISDLTMELSDLGLPLPFHSCYCLISPCSACTNCWCGCFSVVGKAGYGSRQCKITSIFSLAHFLKLIVFFNYGIKHLLSPSENTTQVVECFNFHGLNLVIPSTSLAPTSD